MTTVYRTYAATYHAEPATDWRDAPVGTFAGDPDTQRRGSFGDADRATVRTYEPGVKRTGIANQPTLRAAA
jgi:hypothetical protein